MCITYVTHLLMTVCNIMYNTSDVFKTKFIKTYNFYWSYLLLRVSCGANKQFPESQGYGSHQTQLSH